MTESSTPEFHELMASVGSLLFHWCLLEDGLADDIRRLRIESEGEANFIRVRGSFGDRMREWRGLLSQKTRRKPQLGEAVAELANEIEQLRRRRDLIANDFAGASALADDGQPCIWCAQRDRSAPNAETTRITQSDLMGTIQAIDRCRQRIKLVATEGAASA